MAEIFLLSFLPVILSFYHNIILLPKLFFSLPLSILIGYGNNDETPVGGQIYWRLRSIVYFCMTDDFYILIISHHIIDLKWQHHLKVGTDRPNLEVRMQTVSDDDVRKRLFEKPRFELAAKGYSVAGKASEDDWCLQNRGTVCRKTAYLQVVQTGVTVSCKTLHMDYIMCMCCSVSLKYNWNSINVDRITLILCYL